MHFKDKNGFDDIGHRHVYKLYTSMVCYDAFLLLLFRGMGDICVNNGEVNIKRVCFVGKLLTLKA